MARSIHTSTPTRAEPALPGVEAKLFALLSRGGLVNLRSYQTRTKERSLKRNRLRVIGYQASAVNHIDGSSGS